MTLPRKAETGDMGFGCSGETGADLRIEDLTQQHGLAVHRAADRSYVKGSIRGWSRSHLSYITRGC